MITVNNLTKKYPDQVALDNITTTFPVHQTTAILGPSGSGKSTLLRSLNLLEQPTSGEMILDDLQVDFSQVISNPTILKVRQQFGMVFQEKALFTHLDVLHNLTEGLIHVKKLTKTEANQQALDLLEQFEMTELADRFPYQLSGGQQQRIAIIRALAMHPQYLLLDEPTSALDPELEAQVLRILRNLAEQNTSMIIVTHNMSFARQVADRILFIDHGHLGYQGDTEKFFTSDNQRIQQFLGAMTF
ncbi:amino acid ABC transporter ATP-binding protein [Convivina intestini]|uniref:Amino acid ABC transporter ATP-binding protein (PAAT family) n=1 Tax=Convivina intestini TaxID=1505726 RepID=A0A2U1D7Z3_9LACO|nr:amino acid ABC transporter ATP-binding protein [Convivina intestini]PVY83729.1 amino acid ABC transporter ATP-binding protein (PAAT family) [Convivina intestini]CAH1855046.1 L-cystine import ATP-binding protein TcyC [Convivina intestini]SDB92501.1 cystine transport system ATP-binding protein [Leuconostocaceae bacterium R-53105]